MSKKYLFSISLLISLLIILIPIAVAAEIDAYDSPVLKTAEQRIDLYQSREPFERDYLSDPGKACVAQKEEINSLAKALDNNVISILEKIAVTLFTITTTMSAIDTVISTVAMAVGMISRDKCCTPAMMVCPGPCGQPCTAMSGIYKSWSNIYSKVRPLACFVNCAWCMGAETGGSCWGLGFGLEKLALPQYIPDMEISTELTFQGKRKGGIGQFGLSPFDNIYLAAGCLCPVAIIFNLRKLRTIYDVYDCCIQEACEQGLSTESCERQLDEATCMYYEGSLYSMAAKVLTSLILSLITKVLFEKLVKDSFMKGYLMCAYAVFKLTQIPKVIEGVKSTWGYMGRSFDKPKCKDLGFDDVREQLKEEWVDYTLLDRDKDGIYDSYSSTAKSSPTQTPTTVAAHLKKEVFGEETSALPENVYERSDGSLYWQEQSQTNEIDVEWDGSNWVYGSSVGSYDKGEAVPFMKDTPSPEKLPENVYERSDGSLYWQEQGQTNEIDVEWDGSNWVYGSSVGSYDKGEAVPFMEDTPSPEKEVSKPTTYSEGDRVQSSAGHLGTVTRVDKNGDREVQWDNMGSAVTIEPKDLRYITPAPSDISVLYNEKTGKVTAYSSTGKVDKTATEKYQKTLDEWSKKEGTTPLASMIQINKMRDLKGKSILHRDLDTGNVEVAQVEDVVQDGEHVKVTFTNGKYFLDSFSKVDDPFNLEDRSTKVVKDNKGANTEIIIGKPWTKLDSKPDNWLEFHPDAPGKPVYDEYGNRIYFNEYGDVVGKKDIYHNQYLGAPIALQDELWTKVDELETKGWTQKFDSADNPLKDKDGNILLFNKNDKIVGRQLPDQTFQQLLASKRDEYAKGFKLSDLSLESLKKGLKQDYADEEVKRVMYEMTWELFDMTLGEKVDDWIEDKCKEDYKASYPASDTPIDIGGPTECEDTSNNIYNAQFISKTERNDNTCQYKVTYGIGACSYEINFVVQFQGTGSNENIEGGTLAQGQSVSRERIITSNLCTHERVCIIIKGEDAVKCFPPISTEGGLI